MSVHTGWRKLAPLVFGVVVLLCSRERCLGVGPIQFEQPFSVFGGGTVDVLSEIWAPDDVSRLKGVIIALPGLNHDSRIYARYDNWRQHAAAMGYAILGVHYTDAPLGSYVGYGAEQVAGNMQSMLDRMADELDHPELSNAPIFVFGHSHGASQSAVVAQSFGERTLGFVSDKYADYLYHPLPPDFKEVPGVFQLGSDDGNVEPWIISEAFELWRSNEAKVALGVDWAGHDITTENYVFSIMDEVTKARYPEGELPSLTPGNPLVLNNIPPTDGWLVEVNDVDTITSIVTPIEWPEIVPASEFTGDPLTRSWVPTELMAKVLRADNSRPYNISKNELRFPPPAQSSPGETQLEITVGTVGVSYDTLELYDENGLVTQFGAGSGFQTVTYTPTENGIYTFYAIMSYTRDGGSHIASAYSTYAVTEFVESPVLPGDYNGNGVVDGADYAVWRDALEASATSLLNDSTPGVVDESDFVYWRDHFGEVLGVGSGAGVGSDAVPEPATMGLVLCTLVVWAPSLHRRWTAARGWPRRGTDHRCRRQSSSAAQRS